MANIDENRRRIVLQDWIDELKTCRGTIENDSCDRTGLSTARHEILNKIEAILSYTESKMPGFDPLTCVTEPSPIPVELVEEHPGRRHGDRIDQIGDGGHRRKAIAFIHKRKDD